MKMPHLRSANNVKRLSPRKFGILVGIGFAITWLIIWSVTFLWISPYYLIYPDGGVGRCDWSGGFPFGFCGNPIPYSWETIFVRFVLLRLYIYMTFPFALLFGLVVEVCLTRLKKQPHFT